MSLLVEEQLNSSEKADDGFLKQYLCFLPWLWSWEMEKTILPLLNLKNVTLSFLSLRNVYFHLKPDRLVVVLSSLDAVQLKESRRPRRLIASTCLLLLHSALSLSLRPVFVNNKISIFALQSSAV